MTKQTIKGRLNDLENRNHTRPMIVIYQDWDDPNQWHPGGRDADPMTRNEAEKKYSDHTIIQVTHVNNWRGTDEKY